MELQKRDRFISLWRRYFNEAELPLTFYYSTENHNVPIVKPAAGHTCLVAQVLAARRGNPLCFLPESVGCVGGKRYLNYTNTMRDRFSYFLSHGEEGERCERYKRTPEQVDVMMKSLPELPRKGDCLIVKRWDQLEEVDQPETVIFFATPDVLAGLYTLVAFDSVEPDAVITPFGAGCTAMFYYPYQEQLAGRGRAVLGMFDPSARVCVDSNLLTLAIPISKFMEMIDQIEESFLTMPDWQRVQRRIL